MIELLKSLVREALDREPARFIAYGGTIMVAASVYGAGLFGITIPEDIQPYISGIGLAIGALFVELIRRAVYAPATVERLVEQAEGE